jgi:hypothetical protein
MKSLLLAAALATPSVALACPGKGTTAAAADSDATATAAVDATKCAKKAELVGSNCSYSTGMMAQRVHADGQDVTVTAQLQKATTKLESQVAAPFTANGEFHVIANEVVDGLDPAKKLTLTGKTLEVDGVKYLLVTSFNASNT